MLDQPSFPVQEERDNGNHFEKEYLTCSVGQVVEIDDGTVDKKSSIGESPARE